MVVGKLYLTLYNVAQFLGWGFILYTTIFNYVEGNSPKLVWNKVGFALMVFQNAAILEIFHTMIGLVRAPVFTTLVQVASRVLITSLICWHVPDSREHYIFTALMLSWSITEVVRYLYYAINLWGNVPYPLTWLRYSLFLVLYPSGVASEIGTIVVGLPYIKQTDLYGISMPNKFNASFDLYTVLIFILLVYIPGLPTMYNHMRAQRKKYVGKSKDQ